MIPVTDVIPTRTTPVVTMTLIAVNVCAFVTQQVVDGDGAPMALVSAPLSVFVHRGSVQLIANILCLWLFGATVEDQLARTRFAMLYVVCGILAAVTHVLIDEGAFTSLAGASGAVAGVLGAYFLLYPRSRVLMFVPFPLGLHEIPAVLVLVAWVMAQFVTLVASTPILELTGNFVTSAFIAQIGAFAAGALLCLLFRRPERARVEWWQP